MNLILCLRRHFRFHSNTPTQEEQVTSPVFTGRLGYLPALVHLAMHVAFLSLSFGIYYEALQRNIPYFTFTVNDKGTIINGSGRGDGRGVAMASANHGATVMVCSLNEENAKSMAEEIKTAGGRAIATKVDVTVPKKVKAMVPASEKGNKLMSYRLGFLFGYEKTIWRLLGL